MDTEVAQDKAATLPNHRPPWNPREGDLAPLGARPSCPGGRGCIGPAAAFLRAGLCHCLGVQPSESTVYRVPYAPECSNIFYLAESTMLYMVMQCSFDYYLYSYECKTLILATYAICILVLPIEMELPVQHLLTATHVKTSDCRQVSFFSYLSPCASDIGGSREGYIQLLRFEFAIHYY